ncbi:hypothetical protein ACFVGY_11970 [Streptomyces sp. NPDC127106]|uniref:hypothetical protein n=1 Tax=Streptomyces sp. NPDC127106 TaxID=3345360 RepID=UPI00362AE7C1
MNTWRGSSPAPTPQDALDPYRFPGARDFDGYGTTAARTPLPDPIPDPGPVPDPDPVREREERPAGRVSAVHRRRLALHAALTAAGIPPLAGDLHAIEALSALDDTANAAVQRWIADARGPLDLPHFA